MGLDTECDVSIESHPEDERITTAIAGFRNRLLAEHLGVSREKIAAAMVDHGSVIDAIESQRQDDAYRSMMPLEEILPKYKDTVLTDSQLVDPEQPVNPDSLLYHYIPEEESGFAGKRIAVWMISLLALLLVAAAWRFTPLGDWLDIDNITQSLSYLREKPFSSLYLIIGFVLAGLIMVPITLLIIATIVVFGPLLGSGYALLGILICSLIAYAIGTLMGRDILNGLAGGRISRISHRLASKGILTIVFARIVPVAPFTIINLVAGASHIRLRDFVIGTILGIIPGITAIALLTDRIKATLQSPDLFTIMLLIVVATVIVATSIMASRLLMRRQADI